MKKEQKLEPQQNSDSAADNLQVSPLAQNRLLSAALSVEEGNKLIAEFMGYRKKAFVEGYAGTFFYKGKERFCQLGMMKYHSSWDWLMPVIQKISQIEFHREIQDLGNGKIETIIYTHYPRTFGMLNNETGKPMFRYNSGGLFEADTLIEAAWLATVDMIKTLSVVGSG